LVSIISDLYVIVGSSQMLREVAVNLKLPNSANATQQFTDFIYMTQVSSVTCYYYYYYYYQCYAAVHRLYLYDAG